MKQNLKISILSLALISMISACGHGGKKDVKDPAGEAANSTDKGTAKTASKDENCVNSETQYDVSPANSTKVELAELFKSTDDKAVYVLAGVKYYALLTSADGKTSSYEILAPINKDGKAEVKVKCKFVRSEEAKALPLKNLADVMSAKDSSVINHRLILVAKIDAEKQEIKDELAEAKNADSLLDSVKKAKEAAAKDGGEFQVQPYLSNSKTEIEIHMSAAKKSKDGKGASSSIVTILKYNLVVDEQEPAEKKTGAANAELEKLKQAVTDAEKNLETARTQAADLAKTAEFLKKDLDNATTEKGCTGEEITQREKEAEAAKATADAAAAKVTAAEEALKLAQKALADKTAELVKIGSSVTGGLAAGAAGTVEAGK